MSDKKNMMITFYFTGGNSYSYTNRTKKWCEEMGEKSIENQWSGLVGSDNKIIEWMQRENICFFVIKEQQSQINKIFEIFNYIFCISFIAGICATVFFLVGKLII